MLSPQKMLTAVNQLKYNVFRTDVIFSPDDQLIITGTSVDRGEGYGSIVFLDRQNLERIDEIPVVQGEVSKDTSLKEIWYRDTCLFFRVS